MNVINLYPRLQDGGFELSAFRQSQSPEARMSINQFARDISLYVSSKFNHIYKEIEYPPRGFERHWMQFGECKVALYKNNQLPENLEPLWLFYASSSIDAQNSFKRDIVLMYDNKYSNNLRIKIKLLSKEDALSRIETLSLKK